MSSTENETKTSIPRDFVFESWEDETLNLKPQLLRGLYAFGFDTPSPIQKKAVGPMISKDGEEVAARIFVHDGFAEINGQECSVLAAFAQDLAKADKKEIQDNISQAEDRKNKAENDFERDRAQEVIDINQQILEAIN